jgi:Gpi18-like mannosyltransferase
MAATGRHLPWFALTVFLLLPTVLMNGALWGQCDVMYSGCLLASLYYLLVRRPAAAMIAFGFACSLKPQAAFLVPFLLGLLVSRRLPLKYLLIPPAVYILCGVPAVLAGWPLVEMLFQLLGYSRHVNLPLTLGATNWYQWVPVKYGDTVWWIGMALALLAVEGLVLWMHKGPPRHLSESQWLVSMALLSVMVAPFFLPNMHERYFFAADVFSVVYAFYIPRGFYVTLLVQFASAFTYLPYLFHWEPAPRPLLSVAMLAALCLVVRGLIWSNGQRGRHA